jgi:hypothetical protein
MLQQLASHVLPVDGFVVVRIQYQRFLSVIWKCFDENISGMDLSKRIMH